MAYTCIPISEHPLPMSCSSTVKKSYRTAIVYIDIPSLTNTTEWSPFSEVNICTAR